MRNICKQAFLSAIFVSLLSYGAIAATNKPAQTGITAPENTIVLRIDGKEITKEHFDAVVSNLMPTMAFHSSISDEKLKRIHMKAFDTLIDNELMYKYAKGNGTAQVDEKELDKKLADLKKKLPADTTLEDVLKRSNLTMEQLLDDFRKDIVVARTAKEKGAELRKSSEDAVTEDYMRDYYNNNLAKFKEPEQVRVRTLLIKADPSGGVKVWNASRKRLEDVLATINQGMDFEEAVREYSEGPYAENGGDMGWAHKGSMLEEFDMALEGAKVGDIVGPFATLYGYHLAKLEDFKPAVQKKFEELNLPRLKNELREKEYKRLWSGWIKDLRDAAKIEYVTPID